MKNLSTRLSKVTIIMWRNTWNKNKSINGEFIDPGCTVVGPTAIPLSSIIKILIRIWNKNSKKKNYNSNNVDCIHQVCCDNQ